MDNTVSQDPLDHQDPQRCQQIRHISSTSNRPMVNPTRQVAQVVPTLYKLESAQVDPEAQLDHQEHLDPKVCRVCVGNLATQDHQAHLDQEEPQDPMDQLEWRVTLAEMEKLDPED